MSRAIVTVLALSLVALGWNLVGGWKGAGAIAMGLFGLTMVLMLLSIVNDSDKSS